MISLVFSKMFTKKPSLLLCIAMDLVGMLTYLIPAAAEWGDIVWAPISAYLFFQFFGGAGGLLGGAFSFVEEILPFTDIIPTFTIAWYIQNKLSSNQTTYTNKPGQDIEDAEVIEIK